jgi:hypothetical protein
MRLSSRALVGAAEFNATCHPTAPRNPRRNALQRLANIGNRLGPRFGTSCSSSEAFKAAVVFSLQP